MLSDKSVPELNLSLEESDDEAPEEVTFETARNEALRRVKRSLESDKREKEQLKEKRRKRQELFQEQKKRRLLSADVLEEIDSAVTKKQKVSEDEEQEEPEEEEDDEKLTHSRSLTDTYTVTTKKEQPSFQQQAAEDFLQSRLYGPHSRRTTNNELLSLQNKKGTHKREAVQFVKNNWMTKQKAKAEKLKKRWIHKQNILS